MTDVLAALRSVPGGAALLDAAAAAGAPAFLVGGAVRDLRLGRVPRELDVAVEGDPEPLLAALGGEADRHPRFGTAVVRGDGWSIDIARCRRETYARPGALPDVEPADIATDLLRRDATVNAIAVALADGRTVAAPHAEDDLRDGLLRVLHARSFLDDPTRLWRLARYRARLGFAFEPVTARLAAEAVSVGAPATVSAARTAGELRLALGEDDPAAALGSAHALGIAPWLDPDPARLAAAAELVPGDARRDLALLAAAIDPHTAGSLPGEALTAAERDVLGRALEVRAGRHRPRGTRPSAIAAAYRGLPPEAVAVAPAEDRPAAARWLDELRHIELVIGGDDLLRAGVPAGPQVGARLQATLDRVLDGEVPADRDAQLAAAVAPDS